MGDDNGAFSRQFGFVNCSGKYLTAEKFGYKVNASGKTLKAKQVWTLEQGTESDEVYIKSCMKMYLCADAHGNVTCDVDEKADGTKFQVEYNADGKLAFRDVARNMYLEGQDEKLQCNAKAPQWWTLQLAVHPQLNLYNVKRDKYVRLNAEAEELQCDEVIPWGADALITLDYIDQKYAIKTCDNRYLSRDGTLSQNAGPDCLYTLQLKSAGIAFKAHDGCFLTNVDRSATMKARNKTITKDELFVLRDSHPQVTFTAHNGKYVSIKQGNDVTANQDDDVTDKETFQIEVDSNKKWNIRSANGKYWSLGNVGGIQAVAASPSQNTGFEIEWQSKGSVALKAANGSYVTAKPNGSLYGVMQSVSDKEIFRMTLVNRPIVILKGEYGFVGLKNDKIDSSRATYDTFLLSQAEDGTYNFKGSNGKYWTVDSDGSIICSKDKPDGFVIEFQNHAKLTIKAPNGCYLKSENNGRFVANKTEIASDTCYGF